MYEKADLHSCTQLHFQEARVKPDAAVWNALIAAAGRAGQLRRALEALQDMQVCLWHCGHTCGGMPPHILLLPLILDPPDDLYHDPYRIEMTV